VSPLADGELLAVGRISKAHGIRGEVSVEALSELSERFAPGSVLALEDGRTLTVAASRPHQKRLLVKFEEVPDRTAAELLRGRLLLVRSTDAPVLPPDAWWSHELVGCEVVTEEGRALGPVTEVLHHPEQDVWVTERAMIPAVRDLVVEVDTGARRIVIRDLPGLEAE